MTRLKKNIIANFAGQIWTAVFSIAFIPVYIHFLGIEAYGLIGFFTSLFAMLGILDLGLGATLNRELAKLSAHPDGAQEMRNLVRTLEIIYWTIAILIGVIIILLSRVIANHWLQASQLAPETIEQAVKLMGLTLALQWPTSIYSAGLSGMQYQVLLNSIVIVITTIRALGAILVLWAVSSTIQAFFSWQAISNVIQVVIVMTILWRNLPVSAGKPHFQISLLKKVWRFSAGISGILVFYIILTQMDKIILSKLISLEMFGYYALASVVATGISRISTPIFQATWPRFTQLVAQRDNDGLKNLYHQTSQLTSIIILPVAIVISFFSYEILLLWTQNSHTAQLTSTILCFLTIGTALNAMIYIPVALQYAYGWTKLFFYTNFIAVIVMIPVLYFMVSWYGAEGAAMAWIMVNCGYFFLMVTIMHRRLLPGEQWRWYLQDCGIPMLVVTLVVGLNKLLLPKVSVGYMLLNICAVMIISLLAAALSSSKTRAMIIKILNKEQSI